VVVHQKGCLLAVVCQRVLHPHHIANIENMSNMLSKYSQTICDILARLLPPVTISKEVAVEQQTVMTDEEPPSSLVESFPTRAFGRGTPVYRAFLEALLDGWLEYERTKGVLAYAAPTLPAA
jgi:hypothetical protein